MIDMTPAFTAVVTAAVGLVVWLVQERRRSAALMRKQTSVVEKAMLVLLRNQLVNTHRFAIGRWSITTAELQDFREAHELYIQLGGNGPVSHLMVDLEKVKLIID